MSRLAAAYHGLAYVEIGKAPKACQRAGDDRNVADLVLCQITGFCPGIGDSFLAIAIVQFLGDGRRFVGSPAPTLATGFLQRRQIKKLWRSLTAS